MYRSSLSPDRMRRIIVSFLTIIVIFLQCLPCKAASFGIEPFYSFTNYIREPEAALVQLPNGVFAGTGAGTLFEVSTNGAINEVGPFPLGGTIAESPLATDASGNVYIASPIYGITNGPFTEGAGLIYQVTTNGAWNTLIEFNGTNGANPTSLTMGSDGYLYGETRLGGNLSLNFGSGFGTLFKISTNGTFTSLASFDGIVGAGPGGGLVQGKDGYFYGTAISANDAAGASGTVFKYGSSGLSLVANITGTTNGSHPQSALVQSSNGVLYGTCQQGGTNSEGTAFSITTNGVLTTIHTFGDAAGSGPNAGFILGTNQILYGTCTGGGTAGFGTVFGMTTNGQISFVTSFDGTALGAYPDAPLTLASNGNFYGTTIRGGSTGYGTVFEMTPAGVITAIAQLGYINGTEPEGGVTQASNGMLYGTTASGGGYNAGTIFSLSTNGVLTTLGSFNGTNGNQPVSRLAIGNNGTLYGSSALGGVTSSTFPSGMGTLFKYTTNGGLGTMFEFFGFDGATPGPNLTFGTNSQLYGATEFGGNTSLNGGLGCGTLFKITTNNSLTLLASFASNNGAYPNSQLVLASNGYIYGTCSGGGANGQGVVFSLSPANAVSVLANFPIGGAGYPSNGLIQGVDGNLYGLAGSVLFEVTPSGFVTNICTLSSSNGSSFGPLVQWTNGMLFTTAYSGGGSNAGFVVTVSTNGTGIQNAGFIGYYGENPMGGLIVGADGFLYGTTKNGGVYAPGLGEVFRVQNGSAPVFNYGYQFGDLIYVFGYIGSSLQLTAPLEGTAPFSFQWSFYQYSSGYGGELYDGNGFSGTQTAVLTINPVQTTSDGLYFCEVINGLGGTISTYFQVFPGAAAVGKLAAAMPKGANGLNLTFSGSQSCPYDVWASTNLINWTPLGLATPNPYTLTDYQFLDTNAALYPHRYYELRIP